MPLALGDAESEVRFVPLGSGREIDALVARFATEAATPPMGSRAALRRSEERLRGAGEELRRVVWDPLHISPGGARLLLVVPDGALSRINSHSSDGNSTVSRQKLLVHYRRPAICLLDFPARRAYCHGRERKRRSKDGPGGAIVLERPALSSSASGKLGDPGGVPGAAQDRLRGARTTPRPCTRGGSLRFEPLPASAREVRDVVAGWRIAKVAAPAVQEDVYPLTGPDASERAFKELAPGRLVLHVATHGFELSEDCEGDEEPNPMLLSGLALSGANLSGRAGAHSGEDGLLTSEEICSLDLSSVDWVVLSGCDTGAGAIQEGEGVLGLRRAFAIAGARTVIMSLWEVEDDAARLWMRRLYAGRAAGRSTAEAVREASLEGLTQRRRRGRTTHPFYWGAFVAAGDWR
jgi:hypothetical protein